MALIQASEALRLVAGTTADELLEKLNAEITSAAKAGRRAITIGQSLVRQTLIDDHVNGKSKPGDLLVVIENRLNAAGYTLTKNKGYSDPREYQSPYLSVTW
ncbi:hypothetical protein CcrC1_gp094 [Caulobacter phage C1]|nr:hypothetical protein CcrC1_gp094 [Caulobacter phage C1]UTU08322.1 hypothetical protein CcrC2_gp094 [Caulobacter phage C2]UTU08843.1 hypothetical protein CcrJ4_gp092 [Caulobacter phage J4]UTU09396.1 hypothetical protein CcrBL47_gp110 [Caulobacter phage BL47]UTU09956.1 hypothetical protein CcrRB23_gp094 [Caulobacter phage RB23]WGN96981.1 hypothetical protein [Bertelyvirus sp.]